MRGLDFSSWQSLIVTLFGLALFTLIGVGTRLLIMLMIQQRRERMNRQINERLKTLIAAYKALGGSFTGNLSVDPRHLRDFQNAEENIENIPDQSVDHLLPERTRRIRDAVEAALSDILLLGTEEQVRLAEQAARDLVAGQPIRTHELVVSLRSYIREALDLEPVPQDLKIPFQGPARPVTGSNKSRDSRGNGNTGKGGGGGMGMGMGAAWEPEWEEICLWAAIFFLTMPLIRIKNPDKHSGKRILLLLKHNPLSLIIGSSFYLKTAKSEIHSEKLCPFALFRLQFISTAKLALFF